MWVWGGCCCDFDFVGVLFGVCKMYYINIVFYVIVM